MDPASSVCMLTPPCDFLVPSVLQQMMPSGLNVNKSVSKGEFLASNRVSSSILPGLTREHVLIMESSVRVQNHQDEPARGKRMKLRALTLVAALFLTSFGSYALAQDDKTTTDSKTTTTDTSKKSSAEPVDQQKDVNVKAGSK